jgi:threonine dehydrogenase-like Zn-dependent dehydrogenase
MEAATTGGPVSRPRRGYTAATLAAPGRIELITQRLTPPGTAEVRIRLEGCGVCGSNLPVWEGRPWFTYPLEPGRPGHEGWGVVDAIGDSVTSVRVGDRVAALSQHAFAEYDTCAATEVVPLPRELDGQPFPGEALGCAMNVFQRAGIAAGQHVAVVGIGFLGALLTQLCARAGAHTYAISRRAFAREVGGRMGAELALGGESRDVVGRLAELTGGRGCERVIEATGLQEPLDLATELTGERGRLVIAGYHQDGLRQVNMQLWNWRGLDVINAHERDPQVYLAGIGAAAAAVVAGRLDPAPLYTHRYRLAELPDALEQMRGRADGFLKALVLND